jgi:hypothetical protein
MQNNNFNSENPNIIQESLDEKQKRRDARNKAEKDNQFYRELEQQRLEGGSYYNTHKQLFNILKFLRLPANLLSMFFAIFGISAIVTWFVTSNTYLAFGIGAIIAIGMQYVNSSAIETWARTYFNADNPKEWARTPLVLAIFTLSITLLLGITGVMYSEEFNEKIVQRISDKTDVATPTLNTADLDAKISAQDQIIGKIEGEQKEYKASNKGKSAAWLKADDLAKAKTEREKLIEKRTELLRGGEATAKQTAAESLSNSLIVLILLLVVVCEVFVGITRIYPYYFKREVLEFDGDRINVKIEKLTTQKSTVFTPTLSNEEWKRQEAIAAAAEQERQNEYRRAAAERERQKQLAAAAEQERLKLENGGQIGGQNPPSASRNTAGFKYGNSEKQQETQVPTSGHNVDTEIAQRYYKTYYKQDNDLLLDAWRTLQKKRKTYEARMNAGTELGETSQKTFDEYCHRMATIEKVLLEKGEEIVLTKNNAGKSMYEIQSIT